MNVDMLLKLHPCIASPEDMIGICQPLKKLGITYFGHAIVRADGSTSGVCNKPDYIHFYFKNKFFNLDLHTKDHIRNADHLFWDFVPKLRDVKEHYQSSTAFHLYHTFSLIKAEPMQTHIYHFATDRYQPAMNMFYLYHRDLLEQFIHYYTEQLNKSAILKKAHTMYMPIDKAMVSPSLIDNQQSLLSEETIHDFLQAISKTPTEQTLPFAVDMLALSFREKQCLYMLARGNSAKTIAKSLSLSPRTIYFYIENMKKKVGYHKKNELVDYYWKYFSDNK